MKFEILQVVKLQGTIVFVYPIGEAYEIEIVGEDGKTIVLFTIKRDDLESMNTQE